MRTVVLDAEERARRLWEGRHLHVSPTIEGTVRIDGSVDPESGQSLLMALGAVQDSWGTQDARSAPKPGGCRRELCRAFLDRSERPQVAGERPHVVVTVDLQGKPGRRSELEDTGPITPETCDAGVSRNTTGASEPLDVGRRTPLVPSGITRALVLFDGGCRFPGCGRPLGWCDGHHLRHWADGGPTALGNLMLLCRPHHRAVHEEPCGDERSRAGVLASRREPARRRSGASVTGDCRP